MKKKKSIKKGGMMGLSDMNNLLTSRNSQKRSSIRRNSRKKSSRRISTNNYNTSRRNGKLLWKTVKSEFLGNPNVIKRMNNITSKELKSLSGLHRNLFDSVRDSVKKYKNIDESMFLFGYPTKLVNDFLYLFSLENELRLNSTTLLSKNKVKFMLGVYELNNKPNELYLAISEEPITDKQHFDKLSVLIQMLKHIVKEDIGNLSINDLKQIKILDMNGSDKADLNKAMKSLTWRYPQYRKKYKMLNGNYFENITSNIQFNIIFNRQYINERRGQRGIGKSFEPMYKPDKDKPNIVACNSGSLCTEAKVFDYLHRKDLYKNLKGGIAYWVGDGNIGPFRNGTGTDCKGLKNCIYHPKYCYSRKEKEHLNKMIQLMEENNKMSKELNSLSKVEKEYIFRPFALPCPGCSLNSFRYFKNIKTNWNNTMCYENKSVLSRAEEKIRAGLIDQ